jgi:hypothetical protein
MNTPVCQILGAGGGIGALSGAGFMLGHATYMARRHGCMPDDLAHLHACVNRVEAWPAFQKAMQT